MGGFNPFKAVESIGKEIGRAGKRVLKEGERVAEDIGAVVDGAVLGGSLTKMEAERDARKAVQAAQAEQEKEARTALERRQNQLRARLQSGPSLFDVLGSPGL